MSFYIQGKIQDIQFKTISCQKLVDDELVQCKALSTSIMEFGEKEVLKKVNEFVSRNPYMKNIDIWPMPM